MFDEPPSGSIEIPWKKFQTSDNRDQDSAYDQNLLSSCEGENMKQNDWHLDTFCAYCVSVNFFNESFHHFLQEKKEFALFP